jgi:hypothetical protein
MVSYVGRELGGLLGRYVDGCGLSHRNLMVLYGW